MSKLITDIGNFQGGYFVLNKRAESNSYESGNGFVVTSKHSKGLVEEICRLILSADNYVKVCSFIVDNYQVVDCLRDRLKKYKLPVFILTAVDERSIKSNLLDDEEWTDSSKSRHFEFIDELVKLGAHVRASSSAHAKFVVSDGKEGLIMSSNLTEPSLNANEKGLPPNDESGILINELGEVAVLERIFDSVFEYGTEYRRFINIDDKTQLISKREIEITESDFPDEGGNVIWTYGSFHNTIYRELCSSIKSAKRTIELSTYSIVELAALPELIDSIKYFQEQNKGKIKVFCRAMNHRGDHLQACKILTELGVEVYGDMFNHSKGISADDSYGVIFTANIDGNHGLKNGFEVGYKLNSSHKAFTSFSAFNKYQLSSAPYIFSLNPSKEDLFEFYRSWYQAKGTKITSHLPDSFQLRIRANADYTRYLMNDISDSPIFYTPLHKTGNKEFQFEIKDQAYLVEVLNENTLAVKLRLKRSELLRAERYILIYKQINITTYES